MPPVDVGKSVSRVGGKAQIAAYRQVSGDLRLSYTQFQELESFARFGTRLDERTRNTLEHGRRVREVLKQDQSSPLSAEDQIAVLLAVTNGLLDEIPVDRMGESERLILEKVHSELPDFTEAVDTAAPDDPIWKKLTHAIHNSLELLKENHADFGVSEQKDQDR